MSVLKIFSNYTQIISLVTQIIKATFAAVNDLLNCKGMKTKNRFRIEVVNLEAGNEYGLPTGQYEFLFKKGGAQ